MSGQLDMMMGMLPPGVQQLYDTLPNPSELQEAVVELRKVNNHPCLKTAMFLDLMGQLMMQHGLVEQGEEEQTEALRLECPRCHMTFAVDNALSYRRRIEEGYLYACANEHDPMIVGSGRLGELTPDEAQRFEEGTANVVIIYPKDSPSVPPGNSDNDNSGE